VSGHGRPGLRPGPHAFVAARLFLLLALGAAPLPPDALLVPPPPVVLPARPGFVPAPVPNPDLQRPLADLMDQRPRTEVAPSLFSQPDRRKGEGFVPGSAATYSEPDRRIRPSPGINLRVPLE